MSIKINNLIIENTKRVKAVQFNPVDGLTVIGGKNNQGKTSVLDAIAWALGGERHRPSEPGRKGSSITPYLKISLSNGLVVERKGVNSDLKVIDPTGKKGGQQLLNEFVEQLAIDLPKFLGATSKEKAEILLKIIGVGDRLTELERQEQETYSRRHAIGQIADQKRKFAKEMRHYPDAPNDLIAASDLIQQQQAILVQNGENQRKRDNLDNLKRQAAQINRELEEILKRQEAVLADLEIAEKSAEDMHDESTEALERNIANIEEINVKVRANLDKEKADEDTHDLTHQYDSLTAEINTIRQSKMSLLKDADLPLPDLSVESGELTYKGDKWDNMSGSDRLKVSTAIVRKLNPKCGFVLLDKLEQMDIDSLKEFGSWLEAEGLQAIATRVSTGDECSIVIEDGYVVGTEDLPSKQVKTWEAGVF